MAAVDEAHKWGRGVAAHAIGAEGAWNAVVAGVDSVEHCVQVNAALAAEMKARGTFRSPTLCADPRDLGQRRRGARVRGGEGAGRSRRRARIRSGAPCVRVSSRLRHRRGNAVQPARQRAARTRLHGAVGDDAAQGDAGGHGERRRAAAPPARRHDRGGQGGRPGAVRRQSRRSDRARGVAAHGPEGGRRRRPDRSSEAEDAAEGGGGTNACSYW